MKLVHINKVGTSGDLYVVREFHQAVDPGFGGGLPGMPHPGHELPHLPGLPDNSLPTIPPPQVMPGWLIVLARGADGKWHWATLAPTDTVPKPVPPVVPDNGLPDQGLPPQIYPPRTPTYPTGGPVPPMPTPV